MLKFLFARNSFYVARIAWRSVRCDLIHIQNTTQLLQSESSYMLDWVQQCTVLCLTH